MSEGERVSESLFPFGTLSFEASLMFPILHSDDTLVWVCSRPIGV